MGENHRKRQLLSLILTAIITVWNVAIPVQSVSASTLQAQRTGSRTAESTEQSEEGTEAEPGETTENTSGTGTSNAGTTDAENKDESTQESSSSSKGDTASKSEATSGSDRNAAKDTSGESADADSENGSNPASSQGEDAAATNSTTDGLVTVDTNVSAENPTSEDTEKSASGEYAPNQVLVQYKSGAVTTEKPATASEKQASKDANAADTFSETMEAISKEEGKKAENTLGQQAEVLEESLDDNYEIQDTVALESPSEADSASDSKKENSEASEDGEEVVVSLVNSDEYSTEELVEKLEENDNVESVTPNYVIKANSKETISEATGWNDEYADSAWHLENTSRGQGINAISAWQNYETYKNQNGGTTKEVVAVVMDSGVDDTHEDLKNRMWTKPASFDNNKKLQGFGQHGINAIDSSTTIESVDSTDTSDGYGHGTHCAGIIAAQANNGVGTVGVAGTANIKIMAVKVMDETGAGYTSSVIDGFYDILKCIDAGVNIKAVNCSFGGNSDSSVDAVYEYWIDQLEAKGAVVVASSGNESESIDGKEFAPAGIKDAVAVAATDEDGTLAGYSNYGEKCVTAPGSNILSTVPYDNYIPWRYSKDKVEATTDSYAEFDKNSTITTSGNITYVTPSSGTDSKGDAITTNNQFDRGMLLKGLSKGSSATANLYIDSLSEGDSSSNSGCAAAEQDSTLRLEVENAKKGDYFVLVFPYDRNSKRSSGNTYGNVLSRIQCDGDAEGSFAYGDLVVGVTSTGRLGSIEIAYEDASHRNYYYSEDSTTKSQWSGTPEDNILMTSSQANNAISSAESKSSIDKAYFGMGVVLYASADGDFTVDIASLAVSKPITGTASSTTLKDESGFGKYALMSGTSMATPVVTGTAALIAAMNPDATAEQIRDLIYNATESTELNSAAKGALNFNEYTSLSDLYTPQITSYTADASANTITLQGTGFGSDNNDDNDVTLTATFKNQSVKIKSADIDRKPKSITVSNASTYGMGGNDVTFKLKIGDAETTSETYSIPKGWTVTAKKSGKGTGTVTLSGASSGSLLGETRRVLNGDSGTVTITPSAGSYIYSYSISGYGISKTYGKPTSTSKSAQKVTFKASKDAVINVNFGKTVTKVKLSKTSLKLKRKKSYKLKATVTGTNTSVTWKVSNKKYASVTSSGEVKINKKAKKGKTVTVTAYSKENSKIKATCKIKIS